MRRFDSTFGETITVTPAEGSATGGRDAAGNVIVAAGTAREIERVALEPLAGDEITDGPTIGYRMFLPPTSELVHTDRITIRGVAGYQVEGQPVETVSPFTGDSKGVVAIVRRAG